MSNFNVNDYSIGDVPIIVNGVIQIKNVKSLQKMNDLGIFVHEETGTVICVRYENNKMIHYDVSTAVIKNTKK